MARREYPLTFRCGHEGCTESVTYRYERQRDLSESFELKNYGNGKWRCMRHHNQERVLSPSNLETVAEMVSEEKPYGRYFGSWGFLSGPGFAIYANDFPPGTKLIVTARVEIPRANPSTT